eukprot:SAG11_NODE_388_length_9871_cov_18.104585_5_plen_83_part_00
MSIPECSSKYYHVKAANCGKKGAVKKSPEYANAARSYMKINQCAIQKKKRRTQNDLDEFGEQRSKRICLVPKLPVTIVLFLI